MAALLVAVWLFADIAAPLPPFLGTLEHVRVARTEVVVDGVTLILRGTVWHDFMPMFTDCSQLRCDRAHALAEIATKAMGPRFRNRESLPLAAKVDAMWIVDDKDSGIVWAPLRIVSGTRPSTSLPGASVHGNPELWPGRCVAVVVRFTVGGRAYFLRSPNRIVTRTD